MASTNSPNPSFLKVSVIRNMTGHHTFLTAFQVFVDTCTRIPPRFMFAANIIYYEDRIGISIFCIE